MKVIHYGFALSYIYMGRGTQIPVAVTFLKVASRNSSEGNYLGAMSDDVWLVTRGDGTQRIEVLYECYDKIEWLDFDELK